MSFVNPVCVNFTGSGEKSHGFLCTFILSLNLCHILKL